MRSKWRPIDHLMFMLSASMFVMGVIFAFTDLLIAAFPAFTAAYLMAYVPSGERRERNVAWLQSRRAFIIAWAEARKRGINDVEFMHMEAMRDGIVIDYDEKDRPHER